MLFVQHNLIAQNANRQLKASTDKNAKTTEKLSSGYRINRAADDAAGLSISEKMRRQIRGLMQATANAGDGISYVQTADGAMEEGHSILQRMNELAIKSLNDTLTETDRAALNAEFDQLRTEMDRINNDTEFNNQKVFEAHEPSYYQIEGNIRWNDNQLHTVPAMANDLIINLPDSYVPNEYTITVPAGVYTTQELIDEIDDALCSMSPPNPGFVFEYTDKGYCNLNFESASGMPTKIASVEGSLAYLLYDLYGGSSTGDLLGTSVFGEDPFTIYKGYNDELGFYIESANGTEYISMTIPAGKYTRAAMINQINSELAKHSNAAGVAAKEYGDSNIQITGGKGVSITGLKGNMFKYESTTSKYSSVFYDNVQYGSSSGTYATITGKAYYDSSSTTADINIRSGVNDTLRFKLNETGGYTEVNIPAGKYTISSLATALRDQFKVMGIDKEISVTTAYSSSYGSSLVLSSTLRGSKSLLEFDTTQGSVYANTYDALFRITNYFPVKVSGRNAHLTGAASLKGEITLPKDASLSFNVDDKTYTINGLGGTYASLDNLVSTLNNYISNNFSDLKDKIKFENSSNNLKISAQGNDIKKIYFTAANQNDTYKQLFTNISESVNSASVSTTTGRIEYVQQGSTDTKKTNAEIIVTIPKDKQSGSITIGKDSCTMSFSTSSGSGTITLEAKTYSNIQALVDEINKKLAGSGVERLQNIKASYNSSTGKMIFTSPPLAETYSIALSNYRSLSSAWKNIFGTQKSSVPPSSQEGRKTTLTTYSTVSESTTINNANNTLTLNIGSGDVTINIASGSYTSREALKTAVENAINSNADLKGKIDVSITSSNTLQLSASGTTLTASGSFYDDVLISKVTRDISSYRKNGTYSDSSYTKAFIIGRKDLTGDPVEIIAGANDVFSFDFTYNSTSALKDSYKKEMDITIPEGIYTGNKIAAILQEKIQKKFEEEKLDDFEIKVSVGGPDYISTGVANSNDDTALQIVVNRKGDAEPGSGEYILDGVRGSAAGFIFYKTTTSPKSTYITGTKDLSGGITFQPGKNVLTLSVDSTPYQYTFPENVNYTTEEFLNLLNDMFANGDDHGNVAPVTASIENGALKITHKLIGSHTITDVGGSARSTIFYKENGRDALNSLGILVGSETDDMIEIPRTSIGSCSIRINSITISRPKYAEKAVRRIKEAINLVSTRRSTYGAIQNRLDHTVNNNNNVIENTQASESAIRDTDLADMMMEYSINNILMQAGTSMLAQANQSSQLILSLLQ